MNEINNSVLARRTNPAQAQDKVKDKAGKAESNEKAALNMEKHLDKVEISNRKEEAVTYTKLDLEKKLKPSDIEALIAEADKATENLRKLVEKLILKQNEFDGKTEKKAEKISHGQKANAVNVQNAMNAISEDGHYGVKAVSDRLVDFAITVSGGDKTKLAELTSAIEAGFEAAREVLGGELPEICNQTYDETMRKLNEWATSE